MRLRSAIKVAAVVSTLATLLSGADVELVPGVPVKRELAGGETHRYQVTLAAGQYLNVVAEQLGIDVQIAVFAPSGNELVAIDNLTALSGREPVSVLAETSGSYRLKLSPVNQKAPKGQYLIRIGELRAAAPEDKTRIAAQKAFTEGRNLKKEQSYSNSLQRYEEAVVLWRAAGDMWHVAVTLNEISEVDIYMGRPPEQTVKTLNQALSLWPSLDDGRGEAEALNNLGYVQQWMLGDLRQALEYYDRALKLVRTSGDRNGESSVLHNIGLIHENLGQTKEALQYYSEALTIKKATVDIGSEAMTLGNMGIVYGDIGEYQKELELLGQATEMLRSVGDRHELAFYLSALGATYARVGDFQKAMVYYQEALPLSRAVGDAAGEAVALHHIGVAYRDMGDPRKALEWLIHALRISQESKQREIEVNVLVETGIAYADLGDKRNALTCYSRALQLTQRVTAKVAVLFRAGPLYADVGDTEKAIETLDKALTLSRSAQNKPAEAFALLGRAYVERAQVRLKDAREDLEAAFNIIELTRTDLVSSDLRAFYLASQRKSYELYIDVLMRQRLPGEALEVSERAHARSLLETLSEAHADLRQGADSSLLEREHSLQQQVNAAEKRRMELVGMRDRAQQAAVVEKELNALLSDYQEIETRIRTTSPRYAALTQPKPLPLKDVQQQLLDEDTLLLEYALGDDRSYLWAVTPSSIQGFELPKRAEIEKAAKRVYELLTASHKREFQRQAELSLTSLSQMLLGPVSGKLAKKRLLIVSDGALQYIPFGALTRAGQPLLADHEIVNLPSASVLAILRQEVAGRQPAAKEVAVLSDPVFQADDPRVRHTMLAKAENSETFGHRELTRSATDTGLARFERLPFSRKEAESIEAQSSPGQVFKAVDFAASRETALSAELGQYRIVHFATHGLINSQHPELSGIVLSLVDEQGRPQDGFLRAHEIYNMKLDADLVVLSACQTALGKEVKGEGLVGLTRGFMYAGSPRVVASLWDIKDEAAAELMKRFYRGMLKESLRPAAALRAAQLSMRKEPRWQAPYYWAAFVMQGEWR